MMKYIYRIIPKYAVKPLLLCVVANMLVYNGARLINGTTGRQFFDMTSSVDNAIPVVPGFLLIYVLAFPFWIISYISICRLGQSNCRRIVAANLIGKLLCGIIFLLLPTTNVRPDIDSGGGLFNWGMNFMYSIDKADNLFPSIHCFESWLCFAGIRSEKRVSLWVKLVSLTMAVLICISTVLTKQHVIADVFGGILIAEVFWQLSPVLISKKAGDYLTRGRKSF